MKRKNITISDDISSAGYVRIRKYVVDSIIYGENKQQRLAPMRELAAQFGVGSTTVQKALKTLVDDGFLISRQGVGMFTNPQRGHRIDRPRIIELLTADGEQIYFENDLCCLNGTAAMAATGAGYFIHHVDLLQNNEAAMAEIGEHSLGLIWIAPEMEPNERTMEFFRSLSIPRVVIAGEIAGFDSVDYDGEQEGYLVASKLFAEGRRTIMVLAKPASRNRQFAGIRRACEEHGISFDDHVTLLPRKLDHQTAFRNHVAESGIPDAFYDLESAPIGLWPDFKALKIDFVDRCRLIISDNRPSEEPCWMLRNEYSRLAANGMELLQRRIDDPARPPETRVFSRLCVNFNLPE